VYMHPLAQTVRVAPCAEAAKSIVAESVHTASRKRCTSRSPVSEVPGILRGGWPERISGVSDAAGKRSAIDQACVFAGCFATLQRRADEAVSDHY
jgi:hypothetical protein